MRAERKAGYPRSPNAAYITEAVPEDRAMILYEYEEAMLGQKCTGRHHAVAIGRDHAEARARMQSQLGARRKFVRGVSRLPEASVR